MISEATISKARECDLLTTISNFINLKKRGSVYIGFSPINNERTPSFNVVPSKNIYKDFSSGRGGNNAITYLMDIEGMTFYEAVVWLCDKFKITIEHVETEEKDEKTEERNFLFQFTDYAHRIYQWALEQRVQEAVFAKEYLYSRGYTDQEIIDRKIGYVPSANLLSKKWETLTARQREICSIIREGTYGPYDFFYGRIIYPIQNISGKTIAFTGRIINSSNPDIPKYLHSPISPIFTKKGSFYNLSEARKHIMRQNSVFVVEGPTDTDACMRCGVMNVVGNLGSELSSESVLNLRRISENIVLCLDGDAAGMKAAKKAMGICFENSILPKLVLFQDNQDPDSFSKTFGPQALIDKLQSPINTAEAIVFASGYSHQLKDSEKYESINEIRSLIGKIIDPALQLILSESIGKIIGVEHSVIVKKQNFGEIQMPEPYTNNPRRHLEDRLISILASYANDNMLYKSGNDYVILKVHEMVKASISEGLTINHFQDFTELLEKTERGEKTVWPATENIASFKTIGGLSASLMKVILELLVLSNLEKGISAEELLDYAAQLKSIGTLEKELNEVYEENHSQK